MVQLEEVDQEEEEDPEVEVVEEDKEVKEGSKIHNPKEVQSSATIARRWFTRRSIVGRKMKIMLSKNLNRSPTL